MIAPRWMIWYAIVLHLLWAALFAVSPAASGATAAHPYHVLPRYLMAGVFAAVAASAAWGEIRSRRSPGMASLLALMPQQGFLTLSALASVLAIAHGHYGDGVPRPRAFIAADQAPVILTMILHTLAMIEAHRRPAEPSLNH